jgi:hypothetical protein
MPTEEKLKLLRAQIHLVKNGLEGLSHSFPKTIPTRATGKRRQDYLKEMKSKFLV